MVMEEPTKSWDSLTEGYTQRFKKVRRFLISYCQIEHEGDEKWVKWEKKDEQEWRERRGKEWGDPYLHAIDYGGGMDGAVW